VDLTDDPWAGDYPRRGLDELRELYSFAPPCGRPCVVTDDPGGNVFVFRRRALWLLQNQVSLVVDGPCGSACSLMVFLAEQRACVTPRAVLLFHRDSFEEITSG